MPAGIVEVINNTTWTVNYHNTESQREFTVERKTREEQKKDLIHCSEYADDTLPFRTSGHTLDIWLTDGIITGPKASITDNNWQFGIVGPVPSPLEHEDQSYGALKNGGRYILRLDQVSDGFVTTCGFTFLEYDDQFRSQCGYVYSQSVQHAPAICGVILMALFQRQ